MIKRLKETIDSLKSKQIVQPEACIAECQTSNQVLQHELIQEGRAKELEANSKAMEQLNAKNADLDLKLLEAKKISNEQIKEIKKLKRHSDNQINRLNLKIQHYVECLYELNRDFADNPKQVMQLAKQLEYHIRFDMDKQGLRIKKRLGAGTFGSAYKAIGINSVKGTFCVKIPLNLSMGDTIDDNGSLKNEIKCLNSLHSI